jgi:hypothetical protein
VPSALSPPRLGRHDRWRAPGGGLASCWLPWVGSRGRVGRGGRVSLAEVSSPVGCGRPATVAPWQAERKEEEESERARVGYARAPGSARSVGRREEERREWGGMGRVFGWTAREERRGQPACGEILFFFLFSKNVK